jgi:hypothetical protein
MTITLTRPVATYLQAKNDHDIAAMLACFAVDGVVHDDGGEYRGLAAIREWTGRITAEYQLTLAITGAEQHDGALTVAVLASGNFDGSPLPVIYHFVLAGDRIAELRIEFAG